MPACDDDIEDLEDLVGEGDLSALERSAARSNSVVKHLTKKVVKRKAPAKVPKEVNKDVIGENGSIIPGTQKIWLKTWGCAHNTSDTEYMAGQLAAYGYQITGNC